MGGALLARACTWATLIGPLPVPGTGDPSRQHTGKLERPTRSVDRPGGVPYITPEIGRYGELPFIIEPELASIATLLVEWSSLPVTRSLGAVTGSHR